MYVNKNFFLKLFALFIILILADRVIGTILQSSYLNAKYNRNYHTNYVVNKVNSDVLIFGASRASHHYIPSILSDSLKLSVFNCGNDGRNIYYYYGLLMIIKERYLPRVIILDLSDTDFYVDRRYTIERVKKLAPYYGSNKDLDALINQISSFEKFKMSSMLYRYNSRIIDIIEDYLYKMDQNWENGYIPLGGQIKPVKNTKRYIEEKIIDQRKISYIEKFITFCKQNNIKVFICISPNYTCENYDYFIPIENIAEKYNVPVFNHFCDPFFLKNNTLFKDERHLNHDGAAAYSLIIGKELKIL